MWEPPLSLLNDDNFIIDPMPHGCDACCSRHKMYTADWDGCCCVFCVQHKDNWYENEIRKFLTEWRETKESYISVKDGAIGIHTTPSPVDVEVAREFGLYFRKGTGAIVQRDWSFYKFVRIEGPDVKKFDWEHVVKVVSDRCVILERVPMTLPPDDDINIQLRYFLIKKEV